MILSVFFFFKKILISRSSESFTHEFKHDESELSVHTLRDAALFLVEDRLEPLVLIEILEVL